MHPCCELGGVGGFGNLAAGVGRTLDLGTGPCGINAERCEGVTHATDEVGLHVVNVTIGHVTGK